MLAVLLHLASTLKKMILIFFKVSGRKQFILATFIKKKEIWKLVN